MASFFNPGGCPMALGLLVAILCKNSLGLRSSPLLQRAVLGGTSSQRQPPF